MKNPQEPHLLGVRGIILTFIPTLLSKFISLMKKKKYSKVTLMAIMLSMLMIALQLEHTFLCLNLHQFLGVIKNNPQ
jgi:hypothetical protein